MEYIILVIALVAIALGANYLVTGLFPLPKGLEFLILLSAQQ